MQVNLSEEIYAALDQRRARPAGAGRPSFSKVIGDLLARDQAVRRKLAAAIAAAEQEETKAEERDPGDDQNRTSEGMDWHAQDATAWEATAAAYRNVQAWLAAPVEALEADLAQPDPRDVSPGDLEVLRHD